MPMTETKSPQLIGPGPIGLGIRVILGATVLYWFAALLTKWSGFVERDPIESGRLYTLFTIWWTPEVFAPTFRRPWGWPAVVFVAGGGAIGLAGNLTGDGVWNPVLAGWAYAGDPGALDSFRAVGTWLGYSGAMGSPILFASR